MKKEVFQKLKELFGKWSSFAIWQSENDIGNISMFDKEDIAESLNDKYIFVALNPALNEFTSNIVLPFKNFHSDYANQKDYKLCYALQNTAAWGSYITDLFKSIPTKNSTALKIELKKQENQETIKNDVDRLLEEISLINKNAVLVAIGSMTYDYLIRLSKKYNIKNRITKIIHYAHHYDKMNDKNVYRESVIKSLNF